MNRRRVLASVPVAAVATLAGCAARLGLVDRVDVAAKRVRGRKDDGDLVTVLERRYDPEDGIGYPDGVPEAFAEDVDPAGPLTISEELEGRLESEYEAVRYEMRACPSLEDAADCRESMLLRDDFNEIAVGDTVDVRHGDDVTGIVDVVERRDRENER